MPSILSLNEAADHPIEEVGGKGVNLGRLTRFGFRVPGGFIVTTDAYRAWARRNDPSELPPALVRELTERLEAFEPDQAFAVRSSATMEDLDGAAFAGLHDSFLNVRGRDDIIRRVRDCFHSLSSERAAAYREQRGFDHGRAAMAVVVQCMAPCDRAGVVFTVNPTSGRLDEMVIDAAFGLGEAVVSGETEVDHYVVDKTSGQVKTRRTTSRPCLRDRDVNQVTDLATRIEEAFGFPQDIEWGFAGDELVVLQARSVTSIAPRWTRDESAERYPKAITPLTWDFVDAGFHRSLNYSFRLMGLPVYDGKWFASHGHYIYGNQNAVELYGKRAPFRIRSFEELRAALPAIREQFRWVQELPIKWARNLDHHLLEIGRFSAQPLEELDIRELWEFVCRVHEHGMRYFLPNIAISITQGGLYRQLKNLLAMAIGPEDAERLFRNLTGYCETKTGVINQELYELVEMIRADTALADLVRTERSKTIFQSGALSRFQEFFERFREFLRDHGHREVEFDAYYPTWGDAPWVVLDNLRLLLQNEALEDPARQERTLKINLQAAERELFELLPDEFHFFFFELLRLTREYTRLDDHEHYHTTRLTMLVHRGLVELGRRLTERGTLEEPRDVFFAHQDQVSAALETDSDSGWRTFAGQVREQKAVFLRDAARTPEWVLGEADATDAPDGCLSGIPGSAGQAEGPVYRVDGADDFPAFPKGAVLMARTTNPSWTPMFYNASAVITESGGPLSHGAVTAREIGIPAVMSVRGSMNKLKNGQRVRVDGTRGQVFAI